MGCLALGVWCRGTRSLLTRPCGESSRETGLTGDRRSGGATSEERGDKKHVVCGHGLHTVPGVRNLERKNELLGSRGIGTLKTKQLEVTGSNKSTVGPSEHGEQRVIIWGFMVLDPP